MDLSQSFTLCFGIQALPIFNGENKMRMKYLILSPDFPLTVKKKQK